MTKVLFQDLGIKAYQETWDYQTELLQENVKIKFDNRKNSVNTQTKSHFLFVEHPHVYTLGKTGDISNLLLNEQQLEKRNYSKFLLLVRSLRF